MTNKKGFASIDEYIAACPEESQTYLKQIRKLIHALAPEAKEKISYQIACFELHGRNLIHFAGWKKHVSLYPIPVGSEAFNKEIAKYADGKGTVKFPLEKSLPIKLIERAVKYRLVDHLKNTGYKTKGKSK